MTATGGKHSTLDLCGKGQFTLFTGIGGEAWVEAARSRRQGARPADPHGHVIGPRARL